MDKVHAAAVPTVVALVGLGLASTVVHFSNLPLSEYKSTSGEKKQLVDTPTNMLAAKGLGGIGITGLLACILGSIYVVVRGMDYSSHDNKTMMKKLLLAAILAAAVSALGGLCLYGSGYTLQPASEDGKVYSSNRLADLGMVSCALLGAATVGAGVVIHHWKK